MAAAVTRQQEFLERYEALFKSPLDARKQEKKQFVKEIGDLISDSRYERISASALACMKKKAPLPMKLVALGQLGPGLHPNLVALIQLNAQLMAGNGSAKKGEMLLQARQVQHRAQGDERKERAVESDRDAEHSDPAIQTSYMDAALSSAAGVYDSLPSAAAVYARVPSAADVSSMAAGAAEALKNGAASGLDLARELWYSSWSS